MRYYKIVLADPATGQTIVQSNGVPGEDGFIYSTESTGTAATWTSLNVGANIHAIGGANPNAQAVELDLTVAPLHAPDAKAKPFVKIFGVSLQQIGSAANLNGKFIGVWGGMSAGLPLANPGQAGLLVAGQVQQCIGNWIGTEQSLCLYVTAGGSGVSYAQASANLVNGQPVIAPVTATSPANLVFQWVKGQRLIDALTITLQTAFPQLSIAGTINNGLVWSAAVPKTGYFQTLQQLAQFVHETSIAVLAGPTPANDTYGGTVDAYQGVVMTLQGGIITIYDSSTQSAPKQIGFFDMVGQPTWGEPGKVQLTTVLRGDIGVGDYVQLPPTTGVTLGGANSWAGVNPFNSVTQNTSTFTGVYLVTRVRHVGNSRSPHGAGWVTVFELAFAQPSQSPQTSKPLIYKASGNNSFGFVV